MGTIHACIVFEAKEELPISVHVQETMNKVVKAENEKVAAVDFTTATATMADGARRAEIKKAEGVKQAKILEAEGEAQAIQLVNEAADKFFVGNAQLLLIQSDDAEAQATVVESSVAVDQAGARVDQLRRVGAVVANEDLRQAVRSAVNTKLTATLCQGGNLSCIASAAPP
jgi:regulator of protease activity HflC (stomatin/prohibitin superfamily)